MLDMELMSSVLQTINPSTITNVGEVQWHVCDGTGIYCLQYG